MQGGRIEVRGTTNGPEVPEKGAPFEPEEVPKQKRTGRRTRPIPFARQAVCVGPILPIFQLLNAVPCIVGGLPCSLPFQLPLALAPLGLEFWFHLIPGTVGVSGPRLPAILIGRFDRVVSDAVVVIVATAIVLTPVGLPV
jgi:hypothetical protein